jgi:predicted nucleotidyltransferase
MPDVDPFIFLKEHKSQLQQKYGVVKIGIFGSYARGEQNEESDIDIVVEIESKNKFRSFFALKQYLEKELQKKVDLGIESSIKPAIKNEITKDILYA